MTKKVIAFDLDDTLFKERDFVESGYIAVINELIKKYPIEKVSTLNKMLNSDNAFNCLLNIVKLINPKAAEDVYWCLNIYRNHYPSIRLDQDTLDTINSLSKQSITLAIITDGRAITQTNKINALGLNRFINSKHILISENIGRDKLSPVAFEILMSFFPHITDFTYIGDNTSKDFLWPNKLGWKTICLKDNGKNIHHQNIDSPIEYKPKLVVNNISEILQFI